ncbi:ECF RNA polymerase sigma factor SigK [Nocardia pseudobrasiliensis]|uniref:RNA polymerase sigma-70 factor (ECF subfamily) n=1 Tax=Nocardia pseudobrasiliensis TaxID=45979 RepID=A0A370IBW8_9NOCA|nr:RNA polymerase sigma-70 factor (ECF subfamily) [Nocardia pseudobrasiliensis]
MTAPDESRVIRLFPQTGPSCPVDRPGGEEDLARRLVALLADIGRGDRDAFTEFYRLTSHRVFGLAVRMLRERTAAEEIAQEVYLQAWSLAARYDPQRSSPMGWLIMLTHRRAVDRIRSERAASDRDVVYGHAHLGRDHDVVVEAVTQRFDEQAVVRCLGTLSSRQQETIALAYYSGRTYPEVADELEIPLPTVKSRIRDGLKRLAACLTGGDLR